MNILTKNNRDMTDPEITALAREYAEEENPTGSYGDNIVERRMDLSISRDEAERVLTWLTRRFCLVEKEAVRKQFESAKRLIEARNYNKQCIGVGSRGVLERLFPEFRKDVEP